MRDYVYDIADFITAFILTGILFPVFLIVILLVKIDSSGSIIYSQPRYKKNKKIFQIYKFRTMRADAEKDALPIWGEDNDIRSSAIGKFLRKSHLDEFPQLFNVLKGDMGIVGPRPERPYFADIFELEIPNYAERYKIKPGISGLAQIYGWRNHSSILERTKCDIFYIRHRSLFLNFRVVLLTPFAKQACSMYTKACA